MCEVRRASDGRNTLPIFTDVPNKWAQEPGTERHHMQNNKCLTEAGIHMLGIKIEPWIPIKYTVDPCQTTMKSSREQYTTKLRLEIRKICI